MLWWLIEPERISSAYAAAIRDTNNATYVSTASIWEVSIKKHLGKLSAPNDFMEALESSGFVPLPILPAHAWIAGTLPFHHYDPFDRLIAAHALHEKLTLLSVDPMFQKYGVPLL